MLAKQNKVKLLSAIILGFALINTSTSTASAGELIPFTAHRRAAPNRVRSNPEVVRPFSPVNFRGAAVPAKNIYEERVLQIEAQYAAYDRRMELWHYKVAQIKDRQEKEENRKAAQLAQQEKRDRRLREREVRQVSATRQFSGLSNANLNITQPSGRSRETESGTVDQRNQQTPQRPSLIQRLKRALFG